MSGSNDLESLPAEEGGSRSDIQDSSIRMLANAVHRLNQAVMKAVDAGVSVELIRAARYHSEGGHWGDQMMPIIRQKD